MSRQPHIAAVSLIARRASARWRPAAWVFVPCMVGAFALALLLPNTYQSTLRVPARLAAPASVPRFGPNAPPVEDPTTEQFLSDDVLRQVVLQSRLVQPAAPTDPEALQRLEGAIERLRRDLTVTPMPGSGMLEITFRASSPQQAADVLRSLAATCSGTPRVLPAGLPASSRNSRSSRSHRARFAAADAELARFNRIDRTAPLPPTTLKEIHYRALLRRVAHVQSPDRTAQASPAERTESHTLSTLTATEPTAPELVGSPPRGLIALLGVLIAALLAAASAIVLELFSNRLRTRNSVEQALGLPVLASIPPNAVGPHLQNALPELYLAMQRLSSAFEGKLS